MLDVTFHGVRGSTPCSCDTNRRYGGNTSCVAVESHGEDPIVLDIGTGLRFFGLTQPHDGSFRATALVSHLHWDHVQGLPFFTPILRHGAELTVHAPVQEDGRSVREAFDSFMQQPYFPVRLQDLPGQFHFVDQAEGWFDVGRTRVLARLVPHVGNTLGFRIERDGIAIAYVPDHQQPVDGSFTTTDAVLELVEGVDLLIHDAQYTVEEFAVKRTWGHCTYEYALWLASVAHVKQLALFHHDPGRSDEALDEVARCSRAFADRHGFDVFAAAEGLKLSYP